MPPTFAFNFCFFCLPHFKQSETYMINRLLEIFLFFSRINPKFKAFSAFIPQIYIWQKIYLHPINLLDFLLIATIQPEIDLQAQYFFFYYLVGLQIYGIFSTHLTNISQKIISRINRKFIVFCFFIPLTISR